MGDRGCSYPFIRTYSRKTIVFELGLPNRTIACVLMKEHCSFEYFQLQGRCLYVLHNVYAIFFRNPLILQHHFLIDIYLQFVQRTQLCGVSMLCVLRCSLILQPPSNHPPLPYPSISFAVIRMLCWRGNSVRGWDFFGAVGRGRGEKLTNGETAHVLQANEARERKFS